MRLLDSTRRADALSKEHIALVLGVPLLSALATEVIGIHALFGAFLAGVVMPADATFRRLLRERLETISSVLLMPLFFAFTGLRTQIGLLNDPSDWITCLAIIVVATVGKMGGTIVAARLTGLAWYESVALGALMNTRGLMELIALNVGYDLGILTPKVFTMMVLMALVTTAMTGPLRRQVPTYGRDVLPQLFLVSRADDQRRHGRPLQQPVQRDLWDRLPGLARDLVEHVDDGVEIFICDGGPLSTLVLSCRRETSGRGCPRRILPVSLAQPSGLQTTAPTP